MERHSGGNRDRNVDEDIFREREREQGYPIGGCSGKRNSASESFRVCPYESVFGVVISRITFTYRNTCLASNTHSSSQAFILGFCFCYKLSGSC